MYRPGLALSLTGLFALSSCGSPPEERALVREPDSATVERARQAASALGQQLLGALLGAMERGPAAALALCADSAQAWSARHQRADLTVRRTSLRVRNPANEPDSVERRLLGGLAAAHAAGNLPQEYREVIRLPDGTPALQLARPIMVQAGCLACHGDPTAIAPEVQEVLAERYPADSATGYAAGDLRGMISVRVRLRK